MKKLLSLFLAFAILLTLCACGGNWASVDLKEAVPIPEGGMISKATLQQVKSENAIAVFTGSDKNIRYEWTVFGSDVTEAKDICLQVRITELAEEQVSVSLAGAESFGFSALLSLHLEEKWEAMSATAYAGDQAVSSVSVTGSKYTILNVSLDGSVRALTIRADEAMLSGEEEAPTRSGEETRPANDDYLSKPKTEDGTVYTGKDKYNTDPVPEGKPQPVEPEDTQVDKSKSYTCTFSIECSTILNNLSMLDPEKLEMVPSGGVILAKTTVTFYEGESVFDVLQRLCRQKGIHMEAQWTPIYNSAYVEGIHNLYEFDCGALSGWMYKVNGWYPNYGSSRYQLKAGDVVEWRYTCDLGHDVGGAYAVGG